MSDTTVHSLDFIPELCQNSDFTIILNLVLPDTFASNNKIVFYLNSFI